MSTQAMDATPPPEDPAASAAKGVAVGAAAGGLVAGCVGPIVTGIGFTSSGIAGGSWAAGMMSASAAASGGGVASGSTVAILQSIGAVGLGAGAAVGLMSGGAVVGGASLAVAKCLTSSQHESISALEPPQEDEAGTHWIIATMEGLCRGVFVCRYLDEAAARDAFGRIWVSKVLYDPMGNEIESGGLRGSEGGGCMTIRVVMRDSYFVSRAQLKVKL